MYIYVCVYVYIYIYVYVYNTCITESLCCTAEINTIVNQLYFNFLKSSLKKKTHWDHELGLFHNGEVQAHCELLCGICSLNLSPDNYLSHSFLSFKSQLKSPLLNKASLSTLLTTTKRPSALHLPPTPNFWAIFSCFSFYFYIINLSNSNILCNLLTYSIFYLCFENINSMRASLQVHWLRPCIANTGGPGSIPGWRARSHPPQRRVCMPQLRSGATK